MAKIHDIKFHKEFDYLKTVATLYAVHPLGVDNGIEAHDFFYNEEQAIEFGKRKHQLFKVCKLDVFDFPGQKNEVHKVIREMCCYAVTQYVSPPVPEESKPKYWLSKEEGFLFYSNGNWSESYIERRKKSCLENRVSCLKVFYAFLEMGVNILNDSACMFFVADDKVFIYNFNFRKDYFGNFTGKNGYIVYAYTEMFGQSNVLHFVMDHNAADSFYCSLDNNGEVIMLNESNENSKISNSLANWHLSETVVKRTWMAAFNGGPCMELNCGRIRLIKLGKPTQMRGTPLPSYKSFLHISDT